MTLHDVRCSVRERLSAIKIAAFCETTSTARTVTVSGIVMSGVLTGYTATDRAATALR